MEKELKAHILRMTENANWAVRALPNMLEKGIRVLNSEEAQSAIKEKGKDSVIHHVAFKLVDEYY